MVNLTLWGPATVQTVGTVDKVRPINTSLILALGSLSVPHFTINPWIWES
jgi:hypothetical protein